MGGAEVGVQEVREAAECAVKRHHHPATPMVTPRYASLYFVACVDATDNELITLEIIHHYVEVLDRYFGNVSARGLCCGAGRALSTPTDCAGV